MKNFLLRFCSFCFWVLIVYSCNNGRDNTKLSTLGWLEGTWEGEHNMGEEWQRNSQNEFTGRGFQVQQQDTLFFEKLKITGKEGKYYYVADVSENQESTWFEIVEMSGSGFTCENPDHDFPKKIIYTLNGDALQVVISGDGKGRQFNFHHKRN